MPCTHLLNTSEGIYELMSELILDFKAGKGRLLVVLRFSHILLACHAHMEIGISVCC